MRNKPLVFFLLWTLWISFEFLLGPLSHVRIFDSGDWILPQLIASKNQLLRYGPSYFGNFLPGGVDLSSNLLAPYAHLNNLLFLIFPGPVAYGFLMFIQRFFAGFFTYRLCRDSLKLAIFPSLTAALAYSLFNFSLDNFTVFHQLAEPGFPFFLWALEKLSQQKKQLKYAFGLILGLFWGFSTYLPFGTPFLIPAAVIYFVLISPKKDVRFWGIFAFTTLGALIIQIPEIASLIINASSSIREITGIRSEHQVIVDSFFEIITFINYYKFQIGLIVLSMYFAKFKTDKRLLSAFLLSFFFIISGPLTRVIKLLFPDFLGIAKGFQFRFEIIAPIFLSLLLALSFEKLLKSKRTSPFINFFIIFLGLLIIFAQTVKIKIETIQNYAPYKTLYQFPDMIDLSKRDRSLFRVATMNGAGLRPAYSNAYGFESVDGYLSLYPLSYHKFWSNVISKRIADDQAHYASFVKWGGRIYLYAPEKLKQSDVIDFGKYYDLDLLSKANVKYIFSRNPIKDDNLILLPSDYRNNFSNWEKLSKFKKFFYFIGGKYFGPPLYIYENKKVLPRFYLTAENGVNTNSIKILKYSPDKINLTVLASSNSNLIISINFYPFWKATVNGHEANLEKYEDTFMSLKINKGENNVILNYLPPYRIFPSK